jgi:rSAM/selenodomain-associated transferase 1
MTTTLGIFAKHWQPGAVKTRLAASIGNESAASLHRHFVQTLLRRCAGIADRQVLCFSPPGAAEDFRELDLGSWTLEPQAPGDLGARMGHFFSSLPLPLGEGRGEGLSSDAHASPRTVLIGSDSPDLPLEYLAEAFDKLQRFPVVLGPTVDGGYYLIGLSQQVAPIFNNIPWSTPQVWPQTIARLEGLKVPYHVLPGWYDVDDGRGLHTLLQNLSREGLMDAPLRHLKGAILANLDVQQTLNLEL